MKFLVIQTAFLGDVVLTTPLLAALRSRFAEAEIHVVATKPGCEILAGLDSVRCHALDKRGEGLFAGRRAVLESIRSATGGARFDAVFCVHRSARSLWIARGAKASRRVAFRSTLASFLGFETVGYPPYREDIHYADKPMALLSVFGGVPARGRPWLAYSSEDEEEAHRLLGGQPPFGGCLVAPFSAWGTKMWFADRFARLGIELFRRTSAPIVVIGSGGPREAAIGDAIAGKIAAAGGRALNLVNRTGLGALKALIAGSRLLVANDSAPVHIASAFNVPTVAVFGPTVRKWGFFPLADRAVVVERPNLPCRPCHIHGPARCPKRHFRCMDEIQVPDVVAAAEKAMAAG